MAAEKVFLIGAHVRIRILCREDGELHNPVPDAGNAAEVDIYDPDGTLLVEDGAMTNDDTGDYYYSYATAGLEPGLYKVVAWTKDGTELTPTRGFFRLERI